MKRVKLLLICLLLIPLTFVNAVECIDSSGNGKAGSISVNKSSITLDVGAKTTFSINATCAAGKFSIKSSNTDIVSVSSSSEFLDNSSINIDVTAKKKGTANITITYDDVADYSSKVLTGSKTISINVKEKTSTTPSQTTPSTTPSTKPTPTTPVETKKEIIVNSISVVGYNINFDPNVYEYSIDVNEDVSSLYVNASSNASASGVGEVDITASDTINIDFSLDGDNKTYTIKINKTKKDEVVPSKDKDDPNKEIDMMYVYSTIGFGILSIVLLCILVFKKKKNNNETINYFEKKNMVSTNTQILNHMQNNVANTTKPINQNPNTNIY